MNNDVALAVVAGLVVAAAFWFGIGEEGMHGRMNWMLAGLWMAGGRTVVAAVMGLIAAGAVMLFRHK